MKMQGSGRRSPLARCPQGFSRGEDAKKRAKPGEALGWVIFPETPLMTQVYFKSPSLRFSLLPSVQSCPDRGPCPLWFIRPLLSSAPECTFSLPVCSLEAGHGPIKARNSSLGARPSPLNRRQPLTLEGTNPLPLRLTAAGIHTQLRAVNAVAFTVSFMSQGLSQHPDVR